MMEDIRDGVYDPTEKYLNQLIKELMSIWRILPKWQHQGNNLNYTWWNETNRKSFLRNNAPMDGGKDQEKDK